MVMCENMFNSLVQVIIIFIMIISHLIVDSNMGVEVEQLGADQQKVAKILQFSVRYQQQQHT